jgi:hypothetical protein
MCVYMLVLMCIHVYIYVYICAYIWVYVCIFMCIHVYICPYICVYIYAVLGQMFSVIRLHIHVLQNLKAKVMYLRYRLFVHHLALPPR